MTQLIMNGCTTSSDDQYVNPNDVKLDDAIRAAREVSYVAHGMMLLVLHAQCQSGMYNVLWRFMQNG